MISTNCDIREFIKATRKKSYDEVVLLADREATEAERNYYRRKCNPANFIVCANYRAYAKSLKDFIHFIRYSSQPNCCGDNVTMELAAKSRIRLWKTARKNGILPGRTGFD